MDIQGPFITERANMLYGCSLHASYFAVRTIESDNPRDFENSEDFSLNITEEQFLEMIFNAARFSIRKARQAMAAEKRATRNSKVRFRHALYVQRQRFERACNTALFSGDASLWNIVKIEQTKLDKYLALYFELNPKERN